MDDINTMWVWIPRYSYTIKSENGTDYFGKASFGNDSPTRILPGEIDIKFISKSVNETTGSAQYIGETVSGWRTNEAFNFGGVVQAGIWVGKFETTGTLGTACTNESCDVSSITIKPGVESLRNQRVSSFFYMSRSMQLNNASTYGFNKDSGDLHMMKNDEWGAVAYFSQCKYGKYGNKNYVGENKEIYQNKSSGYITGSSNGTPSQSEYASKQYAYNDMTDLGEGKGQAGPGASTTGNIYGIYDMSGGAYEYVMGVLEYDEQGIITHNGQIVTGSSGFKGLNSSGVSTTGGYDLPNEKYYNKYKSADSTSNTWASAKPESACNGEICYGHALSETYGASNGSNGWYNDYANFVSRTQPWLGHGGNYSSTTNAGIFSTNYYNGYSGNYVSCRLTLLSEQNDL